MTVQQNFKVGDNVYYQPCKSENLFLRKVVKVHKNGNFTINNLDSPTQQYRPFGDCAHSTGSGYSGSCVWLITPEKTLHYNKSKAYIQFRKQLRRLNDVRFMPSGGFADFNPRELNDIVLLLEKANLEIKKLMS